MPVVGYPRHGALEVTQYRHTTPALEFCLHRFDGLIGLQAQRVTTKVDQRLVVLPFGQSKTVPKTAWCDFLIAVYNGHAVKFALNPMEFPLEWSSMKVEDFNYTLPEERIAQYPLPERSMSRMLVISRSSDRFIDSYVKELDDYLDPGDLLVFNNTRVIPARLWAQKESGGRVEIMVERIEDDHHVLAQLRANRKPQVGSVLVIKKSVGALNARVSGREGEFWRLEMAGARWSDVLAQVGHMPLPPYITRQADQGDVDRYQTVYGEVPGAVAAPTAGLHFDQSLMRKLQEKGINMAWCTLHVGAGTFQPVRVENLEDHIMHKEWLSVDDDLVHQVEQTKRSGGRVIAVGTTSVRSLETAAMNGKLEPYMGDSQLFIYPGFEFRVVDGMLTNFHLPGSTLVMLVSAFSGREKILGAYEHAIEQSYRFFSYGDATLLL